MNKEDIISKLRHSTDDTIITLSNGSKIKLSDITDITHPIDYCSALYNEVQKNVTICREALSLEKWVSYLKCNLNKIVSPTLDSKNLFKSKSSNNPIRNNGKWIYSEVITKDPIRFTIIEFNGYEYIVESMEKMNSILLFMLNRKPISNLFNLSYNHEIWWNDLDSSFKENLLTIPVTVTRVKCNTADTDSYKKFVSILYDIPKVLQDEMSESDVYDY